ncbi:MAG: beta-galactosidase [Deltaproteobacteria bacterium]|nr:beta-galactosidase [Deltaproteobacteria bacterium]
MLSSIASTSQGKYMSVEINSDGLLIDGKSFPLMSGSVQPWRLEPSRWEEILDRVTELGFGCIEVYVPWGPHELPDGSHDFSGPRDIGAFLDLAHARNLKVIVRPGPHANAEITAFGYPERLLYNQDMLARGPEGNPIWVPAPPRMFPTITHAGSKLYEEFDRHLAALAPILKSRLHPDGPIIVLQADNEMTFFFRTGAFDCDYCEAAVTEYRNYIEEKYTTISKLNKAYRTNLGDFEQLNPPVSFDATNIKELAYYLDWTAFKEFLMRNTVVKVARLFESHGLTGVPITHNYPLGDFRSPCDLAALEQSVDLVGMDMYYQAKDYQTLKSRCVSLCGASRYPYAPEFGSGCYHSWPPIDFEDQVFNTLAASMHGLRWFNFYMLVDRERWYGAPIRRDGSVDQLRADFYKKYLSFAACLKGTKRATDTVLLTSRLYGRLENLANVFEPLSPMALGGLGLSALGWCREIPLGLKHAPASTSVALQESLFRALSRARLSFDLGEPNQPTGNLAGYRLAVMPTMEILEHQAAVDLLEFVDQGGTLIIGPDIPKFDESGKKDKTFQDRLGSQSEKLPNVPYSKVYQIGQGRLVLLKRLVEQSSDLGDLSWIMTVAGQLAGCQALPDPSDLQIDICKHTGKKEILWLANPTQEERFAALSLTQVSQLTDLWTGEEFKGQRVFSLPMPPISVRPLEVVK